MSKKWARAIRFNERQHYPDKTIRMIQAEVGASVDGDWGPKTCAALAEWQDHHLLDADGMAGRDTQRVLAVQWKEVRQLTWEERIRLTIPTARHESRGRLDATCSDCEYRGLHDRDGRIHSASKHGPDPYHVGLSLGPPQAAQDPGGLGEWLDRVNDLDPQAVQRILGPSWEDVLDMLLDSTPGRRIVPELGPGKRSARVMPIDGKDLWVEPWLGRFKALAVTQAGQDAWITFSLEEYMDPILPNIYAAGLSGAADIAVCYDVAIQFGRNGFRKRLARALRASGGNPITIHDVIAQLDSHHHPRRRRIINRSEFWVMYTRAGE